MITHVVFNHSDKSILEEAINLDQGLEGGVVLINDDLSLGPIVDVYSEEGIKSRKNWWYKVLHVGNEESNEEVENIEVMDVVTGLKESLQQNENAEVWIWMAPNSRDIAGYYWLLNYLVSFQGKVMVLYLNNLPFFNEKGNIFYPNYLHQIPAKEFLKARKLAREITISEFEVDKDEWQRLMNEDKGVRFFEGGKKLIQWDYDYFDSELKKHISANWQKAAKIISQYISKSKQNPGEIYLRWRLKEIIDSGYCEMQGRLGNMKEFEVKQKQLTEAQ